MSTHNIHFHGEIRKNIKNFGLKNALSGTMTVRSSFGLLVGLQLNCPVNTIMVMSNLSVFLTTLFL